MGLRLESIPTSQIPINVQKLDLDRNNITVIKSADFIGFRRLRSLNLFNNQISLVEPGAFDNLPLLEDLKLQGNKIEALPDGLFRENHNMKNLDLSNNALGVIMPQTLKGISQLKILKLDNNRLGCIAADSFHHLAKLEHLTLNNNNLTSLPNRIFDNLRLLKKLTLAENRFVCNCYLTWLQDMLRRHPNPSLDEQAITCDSPRAVRYRRMVQLPPKSFVCSAYDGKDDLCTSKMCPPKCECVDINGYFNVRCFSLGFTSIPYYIPTKSSELRLEGNKISYISYRAFARNGRHLSTIDISNNDVRAVSEAAFHGLPVLNALLLYGNKIQKLSERTFYNLPNLQNLFLSRNRLSCVQPSLFRGLNKLKLLSIFSNNIKSIANGTFEHLKALKILHIGSNPIICDCNFKWFARWQKPMINKTETSKARCRAPRRVRGKVIVDMKLHRFKCRGSEYLQTRNAGRCVIEAPCPKRCKCTGKRMQCVKQKLTQIPTPIPKYITDINLANNYIEVLPDKNPLQSLPNLKILDMSSNRLNKIKSGAFRGLHRLQDLILNDNRISHINAKMLEGASGLTSLKLRSNRIGCINNMTFHVMPKLGFISFYGNKIRCIQEGAFAKLAHLTTLNLLENRYKCDCHIAWLSPWLRNSPIMTGEPSCGYPLKYKDHSIQKLAPSQFKCEQQNIFNCPSDIPCCSVEPPSLLQKPCDPRISCPKECKCLGTMVDCSRKKLRRIPPNLQTDTTKLRLSGNQINGIQRPIINRLTLLTHLNLMSNNLSVLNDYVFVNLTKLKTLLLNRNKIQCIGTKAFYGLAQLRILGLHGNQISTLGFGAFDQMKSLKQVALGYNEWYCDCELKWLFDWITRRGGEGGVASCRGPSTMAGRVMIDTTAEEYQCTEKPSSKILSKCNACLSFPCQNGAKCKKKGFKEFGCECRDGFYGKMCHKAIDACFGDPCENGGSCRAVNKNGRFECECLMGFTGHRCEVNTDDCEGNYCANNSTCIDGVDTYTCKCPPSHTGQFCDQKVSFCKDVNPCKKGSTCKDMGDDYVCQCVTGFTGRDCTEDVDDCIGHKCQNGATCSDDLNSYVCKCRKNYYGRYCGIFKGPRPYKGEGGRTEMPAKDDVCSTSDCQNGGICQPRGSRQKCRCMKGFSGETCDKMMSARFTQPSSFTGFSGITIGKSFNASIKLQVTNDTGVLLYATKGNHHVAMEVYIGHIRVSFDVGNYPLATLFSREKINDGSSHHLRFGIRGKKFSLSIDGNEWQTIVNEGQNDLIDLTGTVLYLGGVPFNVAELARKKWQIRSAISFRGCFQSVILNDQPLDFMTRQTSHAVDSDCGVGGCPSVTCFNGGTCLSYPNGQFECKCPTSLRGTYCEKKVPCKGHVTKDYYTDRNRGCTTTKPIRQKTCRGPCQGHVDSRNRRKDCCFAKRYRNKRAYFRCADGSFRQLTVKMVKKCGCISCKRRRSSANKYHYWGQKNYSSGRRRRGNH